jgi:hypothetical protein
VFDPPLSVIVTILNKSISYKSVNAYLNVPVISVYPSL